MIGRAATGRPVTITGLGTYVPERVVTNDELSEIVDTSDEWIRDADRDPASAGSPPRTSDSPTWRFPLRGEALEDAGVEARDIDLSIVATITPDMVIPGDGGDRRRPARLRRSRGLRPLGRLHRLHVRARTGPRHGRRPASRSARS